MVDASGYWFVTGHKCSCIEIDSCTMFAFYNGTEHYLCCQQDKTNLCSKKKNFGEEACQLPNTHHMQLETPSHFYGHANNISLCTVGNSSRIKCTFMTYYFILHETKKYVIKSGKQVLQWALQIPK